jgi:hypothetical protein
MKRSPLLALSLSLAGSLVATAVAAGSRDAMSLVPPDATSVGFVRVADLRSNPFQVRVFEETDKLSAEGEAGRFLQEAGLNLREDVDSVIVCTVSGGAGAQSRVLLLADGRFDPKRLSAAAAKRGAEPRVSTGGNYYRLKDSGSGEKHPGAVAFVDEHLTLAGSEPAVVSALWARASGGSGFASGQGLGRELRRVDPAATAWALVDVQKWRAARAPVSGDSPAAGVASALKQVTLATFQITVQGDALVVKGTGLSPDEETRGLLEDALRGLTAAWRMAAQEKSPELVAVIRRIQVTRDGEGVTISGVLPGDLIRTLTAEARKHSGK